MNTDPPAPATYQQRFLGPDEAESYALREYGADSYATAIWELQRPWLKQALTELRDHQADPRHLDFACGTGRITRLAEEIFPAVDGVDISAAMVERARATCAQAHFHVGNVLEDSGLCPGPYGSISSFRLLLNLDPPLRVPILRQLHNRLKTDGVLIVNMHGNACSLRQPAIIWKRWRHGKTLPPDLMLNAMSRKETMRCLEEAGFTVASMHGFGILPPTLYRWPYRFIRSLDRWLTTLSFLQSSCIDLTFVCRKEALSRA
jgi:SAM-dependent methyltransferase